jgi:hypothetical protein
MAGLEDSVVTEELHDFLVWEIEEGVKSQGLVVADPEDKVHRFG